VTFIKASSYGGGFSSSGNVQIAEISDFAEFYGSDILIIDDILDTGHTLFNLGEFLKTKDFTSVEFCALLDKPERRENEIFVKYIGKEIENEFVVGYGLDYGEKYRDLPFIAALNDKIYNK
jgi:hypoxanthine phosphoribosyltransferase